MSSFIMDPELIKAIAVFAMFVIAALFVASFTGMTSKVEGFIGVNPYYVDKDYKEKMEEIRYKSE